MRKNVLGRVNHSGEVDDPSYIWSKCSTIDAKLEVKLLHNIFRNKNDNNYSDFLYFCEPFAQVNVTKKSHQLNTEKSLERGSANVQLSPKFGIGRRCMR